MVKPQAYRELRETTALPMPAVLPSTIALYSASYHRRRCGGACAGSRVYALQRDREHD
jgi:hypothetical protein